MTEKEPINPSESTLPNSSIDLNELARQARAGERPPVMTISEAVYTAGGFQNTHMQNPELHPLVEGQVVPDLRKVHAAVKALRLAESVAESHE